MQVQTLTITTERQQSGGDLFRITSFEMKMDAFCDCCAASASGTKDDLKRRGWGFASGSEFCPECND